MNRRSFLGVFGGACALYAVWPGTAQAAEKLTADTLKTDLRAKNKDEKTYIDKIVKMRADGKLPDSILYAAYRYATKKDDYRFVYFVRALEALAKKEKIKLPPAPK
jgi:hypothetical protein